MIKVIFGVICIYAAVFLLAKAWSKRSGDELKNVKSEIEEEVERSKVLDAQEGLEEIRTKNDEREEDLDL
jgi:hypothetical protein